MGWVRSDPAQVGWVGSPKMLWSEATKHPLACENKLHFKVSLLGFEKHLTQS